jgi:hypothetical protein
MAAQIRAMCSSEASGESSDGGDVKTRILMRVWQQAEEWLADAYRREAVFCSVRANSQAEALGRLKTEAESAVVALAQPWIKSWQGRDPVPNCPESKIKLPIDFWYCKLVDEKCPLQGQLFLDEPSLFFEGCLAPPKKKQQIFDIVAERKYAGFHHVPGRYLCTGCEDDGRKGAFRYYYPWELTLLQTYYPMAEGDWPEFRRKLVINGINLASASNAQCAPHTIELATRIDPGLGAEHTILEFDIFRPERHES